MVFTKRLRFGMGEISARRLSQGVHYTTFPCRAASSGFLAFSTGCIVANIYYAQPLLADMAREFGLSVTEIGAVFMLTQIGRPRHAVFVPLGDSYERRALIRHCWSRRRSP